MNMDEISLAIEHAKTKEESLKVANQLMSAAFVAYSKHFDVDTTVSFMYDFADRMVIQRSEVNKALEKLRGSPPSST